MSKLVISLFLIINVSAIIQASRDICGKFQNPHYQHPCQCEWRSYLDYVMCPGLEIYVWYGHTDNRVSIHCSDTLSSNLSFPYAMEISDIELVLFNKCEQDAPLKRILLDFGLQQVQSISISLTLSENYTSLLKDMNLKMLEFESVAISNLADDPAPRSLELEVFKLIGSQIQQLPDDFMSSKTSLRSLYIYQNPKLSVVPKMFLMPSLRDLNLKYNNLSSLTSLVFSVLTNLTSLNLKHNPIQQMAEHVFYNNRQLEYLGLSFHNKILPERIFGTLELLEHLEITNGFLETIQKRLFINLHKLQFLNLRVNRISKIDGYAFANQKVLRKLYMDDNKLETITEDIFPTEAIHLQEITLQNNNISTITNFDGISVFNNLPGLTELWLASNQLLDFGKWTNASNLKTVQLSDNHLNSLTLNSLSTSLINLAADNNHIKHIYSSENSPFREDKVDILIRNNAIECDCHLINFVRLLKKEKNNIKLYADKINCETYGDTLRPQKIDEIDWTNLYCGIQEPLCPKECNSCKLVGLERVLKINCTNKMLQEIPTIPRELVRNASVVELYLQNNSIQQMPAVPNNPGFGMVNVLLMDNNLLESWKESSFHEKFTTISLRNNRLQSLEQALIDKIATSPNLQNIDLHDNPLTCHCKLANRLLSVLRKISQFDSLTCLSGEDFLELGKYCHYAYLSLSIASAFLLLLIVICVALYYRYRQTIKAWLFAKQLCLRWVTEAEVDAHLKYDAFISYAHQDEDFIVDELLPALEASPARYKTCIHIRDFVPGERIETQILHAIVNSRRTIMYVTKHFLKSNWAKHEFQVAFEQSMAENRRRLIVILGEDVDAHVSDLDQEIRIYFNTKTYLRRDDALFWEKLMYAMPHRCLTL